MMAMQGFTDVVGGVVTCNKTINSEGVVKNLCDDGTYAYGKVYLDLCQLDEFIQGGFACPAGTNIKVNNDDGQEEVLCSHFNN